MKLIRKDELAELLRDRWKLRCLEMAGVDNWTWYDHALSEYFDDENMEDDDYLTDDYKTYEGN